MSRNRTVCSRREVSLFNSVNSTTNRMAEVFRKMDRVTESFIQPGKQLIHKAGKAPMHSQCGEQVGWMPGSEELVERSVFALSLGKEWPVVSPHEEGLVAARVQEFAIGRHHPGWWRS